MKYQKEYEDAVKSLEEIYKRKLTKEEKEKVKLQYSNPIAHRVELRRGEVDLRELPVSEYRQLENRELRDMRAILSYINGQIADLYFMLGAIAKKMGVKDPIKEAQEFSIDCQSKLK